MPSGIKGSYKKYNCLFCNLEKGQIYFSDSYGQRPPPQVNDFMIDIKNYLES
jgi:hypothetical protein